MSTQIEKRPLLILLAALIVGSTSIAHPWNLVLLVPLLWAGRSIFAWKVAAIGTVVGLVLTPSELPRVTVSTHSDSSICVASVPYATDRDERCEAQVGADRVRLIVPLGSNLLYGERIEGGVEIEPPSDLQDEMYREEGLVGQVRLRSVRVLEPGSSLFSCLAEFRRSFDAYLEKTDPGNLAPWAEALWFRTSPLTSGDKANLDSSGAYIFVVASGLQIYLLYGVVLGALGMIGVDRILQIGAAAAVLGLYWLLTGMHENSLRALITCLVLSSAYLFRREPDLCSATALVGIFFLVFDPRSVERLGFQLSMIVPLGIGLFYRPDLAEGEFSHLRRRAISALKILAIAFLAGQPLIWAHEGQIGFGHLASSLALSLVAPAILVLSAFGYLGYELLPALGLGVLHTCVYPLTGFFRYVVQTLGAVPLQIQAPPASFFYLWLYYGLWALAWRERSRPASF